MRSISLLLIAPALASCSMGVEPPVRSAQADARLQQMLAGKVAGPPMSCLPNRMANNMMVVDAETIAFRDGSRVYVNNLSGGCGMLGGSRTLVLRNPTGSLCSGQIAEIVDVNVGAPVGGCVFGDFVPYTPIRG